MKLLVSSLAGLFLSLAAFGAGGTDVGRGGNVIALEFRSVATDDLQLLRRLSQDLVDLDALEKVIANTKLETQDKVFLAGEEKDAVNYSNPPRIVIGTERWLQLSIYDSRKDSLVFHEYLTLLGLDDSGYKISHQLVMLVKRASTPSGTAYRSCLLFKESSKHSQPLASAKIDGQWTSEVVLKAETITAQISLDLAGSTMGAYLNVFIDDGRTEIARLQLPFLTSPPPSLNIAARDLKGATWELRCSFD